MNVNIRFDDFRQFFLFVELELTIFLMIAIVISINSGIWVDRNLEENC
jgi:hypothetical protein